MSTPPGTAPAQNNNVLYLAVGLVGGLIFLCGGMSVMALITLQVVHKNVVATFTMNDTRPGPGGTAPRPIGSESDAAAAEKVGRAFLADALAGRIGEAYQKTTETL